MGYISKNRHRFYLKCHLIFVCKYRKRLLLSDIRECVLSVFKELERVSANTKKTFLEGTLFLA